MAKMIVFDDAPYIQTSRIDIMTRKGNDGQVGNLSTCATGYILCAEKTWSELFYQFHPQSFLKLADDRTGSMRGICFEVLFQSMNNFCVLIDWSLIDWYQSVGQLTNFIEWHRLIDWFSDHRFPWIGYPGFSRVLSSIEMHLLPCCRLLQIIPGI